MKNYTNMIHCSIHGRRRQTGFTLLEVLIALLVLSIGLLGLAALQTTGLRSNQMASMRTLATQFTYDITDRMRSNPAGVAAGEYVIARDDAPATSPATIAETDLVEWRNNITQRLPNGMSDITQCDTGTAPSCAELTHIVTVYWNESRRDTSGVAATFNCPPTSDTDFRCFRLIYSE
ncbi:MAG: type IV pilus modification protein PilV [Gammaproteobacteria bacterium]|jgi:type IV pilus assembly protein PilV